MWQILSLKLCAVGMCYAEVLPGQHRTAADLQYCGLVLLAMFRSWKSIDACCSRQCCRIQVYVGICHRPQHLVVPT
jgi:hypothetical protein